jgi:hypothetical protein
MDWTTTCMMMEEVGSLGYIFAASGSDRNSCDAIVCTDGRAKEKYVAPLLRGEKFAPNASLNREAARFLWNHDRIEEATFSLTGRRDLSISAEGADFFLVYARPILARSLTRPLH